MNIRSQPAHQFSKVTVLGLGYVGITMAVVMAETELYVNGVEVRTDILKKLHNFQPPFYETGIYSRLATVLSDSNGKPKFSVSSTIAESSDVWIITVGSPLYDGEENPNLLAVERVTLDISKFLKKGDLVIARSTVPVGITRSIIAKVLEQKTGLIAGSDFSLVFAPERTVEGAALTEIKTLPQIIGGINKESVEKAKAFFELFVDQCIEVESLEAAELLKLMGNAYRDFHFSFANQMSIIATKMGIHLPSLILSANKDYPRNKIPLPSPGVGGACLSKDSYLLQASAERFHGSADLIVSARKTNEKMPYAIIDRVESFLSNFGLKREETRFFLLGLAFKGNPPTSDIRNSVALDFIKIIKNRGYQEIYGYDPHIEKEVIESLEIKHCCIEEGVKKSHVILILNNNPLYLEQPMYRYLSESDKPTIFFDGWNQFHSEVYKKMSHVKYLGL